MRTKNLSLAIAAAICALMISTTLPAGAWSDTTPDLATVAQFGGTNYEEPTSMAIDSSNNIIIMGQFSGTVDFDPGAGVSNLSAVGSRDMFVVKINSSGSLVWVRQFNATGGMRPNSVAVDGSGNVFLTGGFGGTLDVDPGAPTVQRNAVGGDEIFIIKLTSSGEFSWGHSFGAEFSDVGTSIGVAADGSVYATGVFSASPTPVDFDPGSGTANLTSLGGWDVYVLKLTNAGAFVWAKRIGGVSSDDEPSLAVRANGDVAVVGRFSGVVDFNPDPAATANLDSAGGRVFVLRLDSSGNHVWSGNVGGTVQDCRSAVAIDDDGHVYVTGYLDGMEDFNPDPLVTNNLTANSYEAFVLKLTSTGAFSWAKLVGKNSYEFNAVAVDGDGNVLVSGLFDGTADFDPGSGTANLTANDVDAFVVQLRPDGTYSWAKNIGGSGYDYATDVAVDGLDNAFVTGAFEETVDFDLGDGVANLTAVDSGDVFVLKLDDYGTETSFGAPSSPSGAPMVTPAESTTTTSISTTTTPTVATENKTQVSSLPDTGGSRSPWVLFVLAIGSLQVGIHLRKRLACRR